MASATVDQPLGEDEMVTSEDIKDVSFQNHTAAMSALTNGLTTSTNLLDKVAIKKFDQIGNLEAAAVARVAASPPQV